MNETATTQEIRYSPLGQMVLARLREFYRQPEAIFWVYGFPLLMVVALGIAFRNKPVERITVDVQQGPMGADVAEALKLQEKFVVQVSDAETCRQRLRTGKTQLIVVPGSVYEYHFDPTRPESVLARNAVDDALQRNAKREDTIKTRDELLEEPGARYIDFLVPGLLGMNIMGGGLWGVGFVTVDMRIRKLLKRFIATPMKKRDFLLGLMISRLLFLIPEVVFLVVFAWLTFGVVITGNIFAVTVLVLLGAFSFAGLGLLVASRAKTIEAVSGLMNMVMLPMWILSGIFFSSSNFPEAAQPIIKALPLTPLIDALRAVYLDGASLASQWAPIAILAAWGVGSFVLALKWFRWN